MILTLLKLRLIHIVIYGGGDPSLEIRTETPAQFQNVSVFDYGGGGVSVIVSGASNCDIILSSSLDDGDSYFEIVEDAAYGYFPYVTRPYYVTVKKHNYVPYINDTYIQNKTLNSDSYITGNNIVIGSEVTSGEPSGPVLIENGANIILDAVGNVIIEGVFEVETGSTFEVIK